MTFAEFCKSVIEDEGYRASVLKRAREGTLDPTIEMLLLEMAEGRTPVTADRAVTPPAQSHTLALVRPSAFKEEAGE
jgi:hypothetical protein